MAMQQQRPPQGGRQEAMTKTPRFADILSIAWEQHGLKRVSTRVLQFPSEENHWTTIVHATVETDRGVYEAIGDANPENAGRMIAPHAIRFSESRAIARALRWATNAGEAVDVEMGDYSPGKRDPDDELPEYTPTPARAAPTPTPIRKPADTAPEMGATNTQLQMIGGLKKQKGLDDDMLEQIVQQRYSQANLGGITGKQAGDLVVHLRSLPDATENAVAAQSPADQVWARVVKARDALASVGVQIDLPPKTIDLSIWLSDAEATYRKAKNGAVKA